MDGPSPAGVVGAVEAPDVAAQIEGVDGAGVARHGLDPAPAAGAEAAPLYVGRICHRRKQAANTEKRPETRHAVPP